MKRLPIIILSIWFFGCIGEGGKTTAKLELNVDTIHFCERTVGEPFVWNDLQLINTGKGPLTIKNIELRGDTGCAFACEYRSDTRGIVSCPRESKGTEGALVTIPKGAARLVRLTYTPSEAGYLDEAGLVITTDADNIGNTGEWRQRVVSMCGQGVAADTDTEAGDSPDGGVGAEPDGGLTTDAGTGCGSCGKAPKKGAPGCEG